VHLVGCTPTPTAAWVTHQARQLTWSLSDRSEPFRYVIRDRDQKFTDTFDEVFRSAGCEIVRRPVSRPAGERRGGTLRTHRSVRVSRLAADLERTTSQPSPGSSSHITTVTDGTARVGLNPPHPTGVSVAPAIEQGEIPVERRDRLGGLLREYVRAA
jgi:putative transposase